MPRFTWRWVHNTDTAVPGTTSGTHSSRGTSCPQPTRNLTLGQLQLKGIRRRRVRGQIRCAGDCTIIPPLIPSLVPVSIIGESWRLHRYCAGPFLLEKGLEGVNEGRRPRRSRLMSLFTELLQASRKHSVWKRFCQSKQ